MPEKPDVSDRQAVAFYEALLGDEVVGVAGDEPQTTPRSRAARTHLEAVLGVGLLPYIPTRNLGHGVTVDRLHAVADYLEAAGMSLRAHLKDLQYGGVER